MSDLSQRLDRLLRAVGDDGFEKLQESIVSVVFDSEAGKYFSLPLAYAGVPLKLIGVSPSVEGERLVDTRINNKSRALSYSEALKNHTGNEKIVGVEAELNCLNPEIFLRGSSAVIDCTNDPVSKYVISHYCRKNKTFFLSASVVPGYAKMKVMARKSTDELLMEDMIKLETSLYEKINSDKLEGAVLTKEILSMFMGGLAAEETVRSILGKEFTDQTLCCKFGYGINMFAPKGEDEELKFIDLSDFRKTSANVFGAGAIGTNIGYWLARLKFSELDFLDDDVVDLTNVMRTLYYHDRVGWLKSAAAAEKTFEISGGLTKSFPLQFRLKPNNTIDKNYDFYIDGFDTFKARNLVSILGMNDFRPVISASARYDSFDIRVYVPNKTLCFDCSFGLKDLAEKENSIVRQSCGMEFTPQNTWTNLSAGSLATMLLCGAVSPEKYGPVVNGLVFYDTNYPERLFVDPKDGVCKHRKGGIIEHNVF